MELIIAFVVVFAIFGLAVILKELINEKANRKFVELKKTATKEITDAINIKQETLDDINHFFAQKGQVVSLLQLVSMCCKEDLILKEYQKTENVSFMDSRESMTRKLNRKEIKRFPKDVVEINGYINKLKREIKDLKGALVSVQNADKGQLDEIVIVFCPMIEKAQKKKRRKVIAFVSLTCIGLISAMILLSSNFAMFMAENYHIQVLNEALISNDIQDVLVKDVEYSSKYNYYDYGDSRNYFTNNIVLEKSESSSIDDIDDFGNLKELYSMFSLNIDYWWGPHELYFENSDDFKITVVINDGEHLITNPKNKKYYSKIS